MKRKGLIRFLLFIVVSSMIAYTASAISASQASETPKKKLTYSLTLGTTSVGSSNYTQGVGIANLISKKAPGIDVTARPIGGTDANVRACRDGKVDLAIVGASSAAQGYLGQGAYSGEQKAWTIRLLLQGFPSPRFIAARKASKIEKLEDLRGKTIVGRRPALADLEIATLAYLEVGGIPKDQVKIVETVEVNEALDALKIGSVDAVTLPQTFKAPGFQELARTVDIVVPSLTQDQMKKMLDLLGPGFRPLVVPMGTFKGQAKEVLTIATPMVLIGREDLPQEVIYTFLKTMIDNEKDVKALHSEAEYWTIENTLESPPLPFQQGAIKLLKEKGSWNSNLDAWQKKMLSMGR